jgi:hypothetical protein
MKINVYSVAERRPPVGERIIRYGVFGEENEIAGISFGEAAIAVVEEDDLEFCAPDLVTDMVWVGDLAEDMKLDDLWSFAEIKIGD